MKKALVAGAGGFIGGHLVKKLKDEGYWVRAVDIKAHEFTTLPCDEFVQTDLRDATNCEAVVTMDGAPVDEVYQLAADVGGVGFLDSAECEIMRNSALVNINMVHAAASASVSRYFLSSSACVYRDMTRDEPDLAEEDAYPAIPNNEYGWEKIYAERMALAYGRKSGMQVRIARFQNCYGPEGTWTGGREKAPAAVCRKIASIEDGGTIEVWGDGTAMRAYTLVEDMVDGIYRLMQSDHTEPINIGRSEYVSVDELVNTVAEVAGKTVTITYIDGPVGVLARNFTNDKIQALGWSSAYSLKEGIAKTYPWVKAQVEASKG